MKFAFDNGWRATVTNEPLPLLPRFFGTTVHVVPYANVVERERFLVDTFGSQDWLLDDWDVLRFDPTSRQLVGFEFTLSEDSAAARDAARVPAVPAVRPGGLRADEMREFRQSPATVLCRAPGDAVLTCLRDLDVLDEPLQARVGIAPDVALLVQHDTVVGWSLTDPARYLTHPHTDPDPAPPSTTTRQLFTECMNLITTPLVYEVEDGEPAALARLRAADEALHGQREDRQRADALVEILSTMVHHYLDGPSKGNP
ncbi:hypothetical protein [Streptomyces sp. NPDC002490]|uniref:hypothetical protein n=1 Tax=Streptomyces sp. NPDC002490 TaxID=3154416 RepID=UPI00331A016D